MPKYSVLIERIEYRFKEVVAKSDLEAENKILDIMTPEDEFDFRSFKWKEGPLYAVVEVNPID